MASKRPINFEKIEPIKLLEHLDQESEFNFLCEKLEHVFQEWIFAVSSEDSKIESNFSEFMQVLSESQSLAQKLLDKLGWTDRNPLMTSHKLLSEYTWDR